MTKKMMFSSQLAVCEQYIPLKDAHSILCDKKCFDNNFIAFRINFPTIINHKILRNWKVFCHLCLLNQDYNSYGNLIKTSSNPSSY